MHEITMSKNKNKNQLWILKIILLVDYITNIHLLVQNNLISC